MSKAREILHLAEQIIKMATDKDGPYNRLSGSARSKALAQAQKDNKERKARLAKAKNQYLAGMIDRDKFRDRSAEIKKAISQERKRLQNKSFKPKAQGPLNIYDLRGSKER